MVLSICSSNQLDSNTQILGFQYTIFVNIVKGTVNCDGGNTEAEVDNSSSSEGSNVSVVFPSNFFFFCCPLR